MQLSRQIEVLLPELQAYAGAICDVRYEAQDLVQDAVERAMRAKAPRAKPTSCGPGCFACSAIFATMSCGNGACAGNIPRAKDVS